MPGNCRSLVRHLAHTIPWAGHLGHYKTYLRLASRFFWPFGNVHWCADYAKRAQSVKKTVLYVNQTEHQVQAMPVITTLFKRIAIDIVGSLEKSTAGYQYILVICDYASRFPEAFP